MNPKYSVIQYVRKKGIPFGAIVAIKTGDSYRIGYSMCNTRDRFKKTTGLKIAFGRAESWESIPQDIPNEILKAIPAFVERCKKYYKTDYAPKQTSTCPF